MKKVLFFVLTLMGTLAASAYDYPYMAFRTVAGDVQTVAVESLTMTFEDGRLVAHNAETEVGFVLDNLDAMFFASEPSSITEINGDAAGVVDVYTVLGVRIGRYESMSQAKNLLHKGLYLIKQNGVTRKIVVQ